MAMITLTRQDVAEFRALYHRETGREISEEQAAAYAENLLQLVAFVAERQS